jgi:type I restriction enzyme S subunit
MNMGTAKQMKITVGATHASPQQRELPSGWRWVRLGAVGSFEAGGTPAKAVGDYWGGDIPFVTGADITELLITRHTARAYLTEEGLRSGKTVICHPGTVLLVTRTRVGRAGIATELMGASQDITAFLCGSDLYPEYLCRYLISISTILIDNTRGATIQGLTRDFVYNLNIPLPPLNEQRRIAGVLREQIAAVEKARAAAEEELNTIKALPAALLRRAFNGEL